MRSIWKLASVCLLLVFASLYFPGPVYGQEPDFSGTNDILNGETHLLRSDDIAWAYAQNATAAPYANLLSTNLVLTNDSAISAWQSFTTTSVTSSPLDGGVKVAVGRMFDLPNDLAAVLAVEAPAPGQPAFVQLTATLYDQLSNRTLRQVIGATKDASATPILAVMADFSGDGFDDLAVGFGGVDGISIAIIQAANPRAWVDGLRLGPIHPATELFAAAAAADVDGDGQPELVAVTNGIGATGSGGQMVVLAVDPLTLALTTQATTSLGAAGMENLIASGDYDGNPADDEVVVALSGNASIRPALQLYDFPSQPPVGVLLDQVNTRDEPVTGIELAAGRIHWFGADGDAIVVAANNANAFGGGDYLLSVFTVVQNKLALQTTYTDGANENMLGMALGRFDTQITAGSFNPDLQLAAIVESDIYGDDAYVIMLYTFGSGGSGYAVNEGAITIFGLPIMPQLALATGDLQGRSLRLGTPDKITINGHNAPGTIVGVPPMHIDWVIPSCSDPNYPKDCTTVQQVSILAKPASNYAQLNTQIKQSSQSSSKHTTSYSLATKETVSAKVAYGIPGLASVSIEAKDSARQTYDKSVATINSSYASVAFDASVRTGFADHVWFDNYRFTIWTYPVLGQTVCPAAKPNCTPGEEVPLHLQFSGPDQINTYDLDCNVLEWCQPVWEPGNLLSYPWTEAQLAAFLPRTTIVNKSDVWAADTSGSNASVTWSQGGGQDVSQGSSKTYANDASISVAANASIAGFGISGSAAFDASTSNSTQTLNTSSNTHGASTGFSIAKTAQGVADYIFAAQTYILGQAPITGTLQSLPLTTTVQTSGLLRLAYWANPYDPVVGGEWWGTAYSLPDAALNHPQRWTWTSTPTQPNIMTFNYAVTSTSPFDQEFYLMRGLYVTSLGAPDGPQLVTAPVSQTVLLQARVYNYSHVDMNAPSLAQKAATVKVRFYGQLFQSDSGDYPVGGSFLIGEQALAPIPGHASATTAGDLPNWNLAVQPFDPAAFSQTAQGDVYVRFWVLVWMEDAAGKLVQEMAGHGLTVDPATAAIKTMGDVAAELYSNNVGAFKQVFYVAGAKADEGAPAGRPPALALSALPLAPITLPAPLLPTSPLGKHLMTTVVRNGPSAEPVVQLLYYDGDPARGGRLFDWEMIPQLGANAQHVNRVTYTPPACGERTIYVTVRFGKGEITTSTPIDNPPCRIVFPFVRKD